MSGLFEFLSTTTGGVLLVAGTLGFSAAACSAPRWAAAARACHVNSALSPLWLLLPILLGFVLTWWGNDVGILLNANGVEVPALFLLQLGVSAWVVYRHRRWPFLVLPLAILCCLWQWGLMMGVVLNGVNALSAA